MATATSNGKKRTLPEIPPEITGQVSYSGTPRWREETQPDEYVRELADPVKRMELFDEMRSSDESVNTAISAREQMIGSAAWLMTHVDDTPKSREVLEFCEDNIYPLLGELLRHMAGAIQYGFGTVEKVFEWADAPFTRTIARAGRPARSSGRRIYLKHLAHIRQRTIHSFLVPEKGQLSALRQYVWSAGRFQKTDIAAERLLLWTYNRRGDDYWGVPPSRHVYRAWKFKQQIEKLNLLGFDRFGTGTPVGEEGPDWSQPERDRFASFLRSWRAGTNSFLMYPSGGKIELKAGDGQAMGRALDWVKFYNLGIAKTYLTQGTELGSTETGARALGETFYEQTESIVQSDCEDIATIINENLIVPLVMWNFGPQENYPAFAPSQKVRQSGAIAQVIQQLITSRAVIWDESDEAWLRDKLDWPEIDLDAREAKKKEQEKIAKQITGAPAAVPPGTTEDKQPAANQLRALRGTLSGGGPVPAVQGESTYRTRDFSEWEQRILRPEILSRDLDMAAVRVAGEVQDVLREIDADLLSQAATLAMGGAVAIAAGVRKIAAPAKLREKLRVVLRQAAERSRSYGHDSVYSELARMRGPESVEPTRRPDVALRQLKALGDMTPLERARELILTAEVERTAEDEIERRERSVRDSLVSSIAFAGSLAVVRLLEVVKTAVAAALESLSTARTADNVTGVVNAGFGVGRQDAATELIENPPVIQDAGAPPVQGRVVGRIDRLIQKVYSAVMDAGTCDECAKWDGAVFSIDYPEDFTGVSCPNPRCAGSYKRCRCVWIWITESEAQSVPASKGPLDYPRAA